MFDNRPHSQFNIYLDWREFSKTSRPSICDLRFEEILNKIKPERIFNERGAIAAMNSSISSTINTNLDGNGLLKIDEQMFVVLFVFQFFISFRISRIININQFNSKSSTKLRKSST